MISVKSGQNPLVRAMQFRRRFCGPRPDTAIQFLSCSFSCWQPALFQVAASSHTGRFINWDYEIGHGSFTAEEQQAILSYATGQCEPVREILGQGSVSKVPLKSKPGASLAYHFGVILHTAHARQSGAQTCQKWGGDRSVTSVADRSIPIGMKTEAGQRRSRDWGFSDRRFANFPRSTGASAMRSIGTVRWPIKIADDHCYWGDNRWLLPSDGPDMKRYFGTRIQMCKERGFTGVEADNMDAASQEELRGQTSLGKGVQSDYECFPVFAARMRCLADSKMRALSQVNSCEILISELSSVAISFTNVRSMPALKRFSPSSTMITRCQPVPTSLPWAGRVRNEGNRWSDHETMRAATATRCLAPAADGSVTSAVSRRALRRSAADWAS